MKTKSTIIRMLKNEFPNIEVTDTPIDVGMEDTNSELLCAKKIDNNNIKVIDSGAYFNYRKEEIPILENIVGTKVVLNNKEYEITQWNEENGVVSLTPEINSIYEYNDVLKITSNPKAKDFILCYAPYQYSKTKNYNLVENYQRFHIDVFIQDDLNNNKIAMYTTKIGRLFNRDFVVLDENNKKTKESIYIASQLYFDIGDYNITNKILRGSMLLKTYSS